MSWANKYKGRQPEVAFKHPKAANIERAIHDIAQMQFKMHKYDFTANDLLRLFVAPDYREVLTNAYKIAPPRGFVSELYVTLPVVSDYGVEKGRLRFSWDCRSHRDGFTVPTDEGASPDTPVLELQADCPEELRKTFMRTFNDMVDIAYRFGMCKWVFQQLNKPTVCKTPPQLRYYWPAVLPLMRKAGFREEADAMNEASPRAGQAVRLPQDVAPYLKETNETLARAHFIDADQAAAVRCKMTYSMLEIHFKDGKFPGLI